MSKMIAVKGDELREVISRSGQTMSGYDREIGYAEGHMSNSLGRGTINQVCYNFLAKKLQEMNLDIKDYTIYDARDNTPEVSKTVDIDPNIIERYCEEHKTTKAAMARGIGRNREFIQECVRRRDCKMGRNDYLAIKAEYGIDIAKSQDWQEVAVRTQEELAKPKATRKLTDSRLISELTADELQRLIYRSVYSAIKHSNNR